MPQFETLSNEELRKNIQETKETLIGLPQIPNPMAASLMFAAMDTFRKVNAEPLEGEDPEEHEKLLAEYDEFIVEMKARIPAFELPKMGDQPQEESKE